MKDAADALTRLGAIATAQAEHDTARRHLEEALRLYRENGEKTGEAEALEAMALLLEHAGDHSGAQSLRQQASALVKTGG
jgi:tetratricopeptide (TPR) repeat protein